MHRSTHLSANRVRIEARRAGHPSHSSHCNQRRKGTIAEDSEYLDSTGLLIEGTELRSCETQLPSRLRPTRPRPLASAAHTLHQGFRFPSFKPGDLSAFTQDGARRGRTKRKSWHRTTYLTDVAR